MSEQKVIYCTDCNGKGHFNFSDCLTCLGQGKLVVERNKDE